MRRIIQAAVLAVAALSVSLGFTATAGAVHWHVVNPGAFHSTGGAATWTPHGVGPALNCVVSTEAGTSTKTGTAAMFPLFHGTATYFGCNLGGIAVNVDCGFTVTAGAWNAGPPAVTSGPMDFTCGIYQGAANLCHIEGQTPVHYTDATGHAAGLTGRLTLTHSTGLFATNGQPGFTCPLGGDNGSRLTMTEQTWTFITATGPRVVRTP